jgi:phage shock protein A
MLNYKLSDNAKFNALWSLLNVNYTEANNWLIEYDICEIYDDYAVVRNYSEGCFERVYYTKNDETDSVELGERVRCFIMDVSEAEKNALDALHAMNEGTYEKVDENFQAAKTAAETAANDLATKVEEYNTLSSTVETLTTEKSNFETKIGELEESISTLTTERNDAQTQLEAANNSITTLTEENASLNSFKAEVEKQQKQAVISKYTELLDEDVLNTYSENLDKYTAKDLDKELAYELVSANQSVFTNGGQNNGFIPKEEPAMTGLEEILSKYKKN